MPVAGFVSNIRKLAGHACAWIKEFGRAEQGATAVIFGIVCIVVLLAGGVGLDMARAMVMKSRLADALDAAGLAVGTTTGLTQTQMQALAQKYFDANYPATALGTHGNVSVTISGTNGSIISLAVTGTVPTTLMQLAHINTLDVAVSNQISKSLTKLWVSLVLDNTGSMCDPDSCGPNSKLAALKTATGQLLTTLQNAASNPGDVKVALIPFSRSVNVGTSNVNASWIDWTDWEAPPGNGSVSVTVGPGSTCPYTTNNKGYRCQSTPTNGSSNANNVPSSGAYAGYICPGVDNGSQNDGRKNRYYNGCYNSVGTTYTGTTTATDQTTVCNNKSSCTTSNYCSGYPSNTSGSDSDSTWTTHTTCECHNTNGNKHTCTRTATTTTTTTTIGAPYTHTWIVNNHSTWGGCVMDRNQDYDVSNTTPSSTATKFPAENSTSCVPSVMKGTLSNDWTGLQNVVTAMSAGGSTNQPIGLAWGWQALTDGNPLNPGTLPQDTTQVIILLSDGLNTQDRWYGDGSNQSTDVDDRMTAVCNAVRNATPQIQVYTVYVDLAGTNGNSTVMQNCATDLSKYYDLTTSGAIITTFNQIGQTLANLHVAR